MVQAVIIIYLVGLILACDMAILAVQSGWQFDQRWRVMLRVLAWPYWLGYAIKRLG